VVWWRRGKKEGSSKERGHVGSWVGKTTLFNEFVGLLSLNATAAETYSTSHLKGQCPDIFFFIKHLLLVPLNIFALYCDKFRVSKFELGYCPACLLFCEKISVGDD
jgi:hypothetical protein